MWSTDSSFLLHMQYLSITMTCCLLRLSDGRILPRVANHVKKAALEGARVRQTLFQESFAQARPYKIGKATFRPTSPHQRSCQKLILDSSPTSNLVKVESFSHSFVIFFHNSTPKRARNRRERGSC